jgi:glycosyltransferase involved in cell wall biosynthesis
MNQRTEKSRIAIVVQRFGTDVNGGAEQHARQLAERLSPLYEVDVLTSCALDSHTWDMHYPVGAEQLDYCTIHRFAHPPRDRGKKYHLPIRSRLRFIFRKLLNRLSNAPLVPQPDSSDELAFARWLQAQGPYMPDFERYLQEHGDEYTAIIFFTILFYPAARGICINPRKSILVPTLHDERAVYRPMFRKLFAKPAQIMYNTGAEMRLAHRLFGSNISNGEVCGLGVEIAQPNEQLAQQILEKYGLRRNEFIIYVGRIEKAKGCDVLIEHMQKFNLSTLKLVLVGKASMPIPVSDKVLATGFISDQERNALVKAALALVIPSQYESLSIVLLESFALGTPVLVNEKSEVLVEHVNASQAGFCYSNFSEFTERLLRLASSNDQARDEMAIRGKAYVAQTYAWPVVIRKFQQVIARIGSVHPHRI